MSASRRQNGWPLAHMPRNGGFRSQTVKAVFWRPCRVDGLKVRNNGNELVRIVASGAHV